MALERAGGPVVGSEVDRDLCCFGAAQQPAPDLVPFLSTRAQRVFLSSGQHGQTCSRNTVLATNGGGTRWDFRREPFEGGCWALCMGRRRRD